LSTNSYLGYRAAAAGGGAGGFEVMRDDDEKSFSMDLMAGRHADNDYTDVFYDTESVNDLFSNTDLSDLYDLDLSDSKSFIRPGGVDLLADCEPLVHDGNGELMQDGDVETQTLQMLSQAGIQQPAERQIRLHSELAHHLSTSPSDDSMLARPDSMLLKTQTSSSESESELVKMLTSVLEDASSVAQLFPRQQQQQQHVPMVTVTSANVLGSSCNVSADSELARQLSLCTNDMNVAGSAMTSHHQQKYGRQRVALVQPTVARPAQTSQMIVHHHPQSLSQLAGSTQLPQSTLSAESIQQIIQQTNTQPVSVTQPVPRQIVLTTQAPAQTQHETTQPAPRQIVITTQAPVQTQQVPQISLQQLQQVVCHSH